MASYHVEFTTEPSQVREAQQFRGRLFRGGAIDHDAHDLRAIHGVLRDQSGDIQCVFRMLPCETDHCFDQSYSAQFYDLTDVKKLGGKALELGRFCVSPECNDPNVLRLAWAEITQFVLDNQIDLLFGCSSFTGADVEAHADALALLKERHLAPTRFRPRIKAPKVFEFAQKLRLRKPNLQIAQRTMPPLLRSYLMMGGWVSDHAVIDHDLNTVHVFTGVEIKRIPPARRKLFTGLLGRKPGSA